MLVIRDAQLQVFRQQAQARFEERLVDAFLKDLSPGMSTDRPAAGLRSARWSDRASRRLGLRATTPNGRSVRDAIAKAQAYGIQGNGGPFLCVAHMFMLGSGFDRDPLLPWAGDILTDPAIASAADRIDRLYRAGLAHLEQSPSS